MDRQLHPLCGIDRAAGTPTFWECLPLLVFKTLSVVFLVLIAHLIGILLESRQSLVLITVPSAQLVVDRFRGPVSGADDVEQQHGHKGERK